jgi:DNA primase
MKNILMIGTGGTIASELTKNGLAPELTTKQEKEKACHDIIYAVKKNSYEYFTTQLGADVTALNKVITGKKALEELAKTHISLD